jgi:hypothetical protein
MRHHLAPAALAVLACVPASAQTLLGPTPYLSEADSPFAGSGVLVLENFEDHVQNLPAATVTGGVVTSSQFSGSIIDSVDGDDGVINGSCLGGDSYFAGSTVSVVFSSAAPGGLPTRAGLVWTDGPGGGTTATFEAFDGDGKSLGKLVAPGMGDSSNNGTTAEDRFFGIEHAGGIKELRIVNVGAIEVDHLQYVQLGSSSYCTAGTSASGCQTLISGTGAPSASSGSGFTLTGLEAEGSKTGIFFFGTSGRQATSWGNGTSFQCVVPPVKRLGLQSGVGTNGQCDGAAMQDVNLAWTAKPAKNPGAGAVVQAQFWYRDPPNTSNQTTSLSNAIEWTVCP